MLFVGVESSSDQLPRAETRLLVISINVKTIISVEIGELIINSHFTEPEGMGKKGKVSSWREKIKQNYV